MEAQTEFTDGDNVRHVDTKTAGRINGTIVENGSLKQIVVWKNGRISYVTADNLERIS